MRSCKASFYAERHQDVGRCLRESTGEKAGIVADGNEKRMAFRITRSKGAGNTAGGQSNAIKGKIPGDDPAPSVRPKADLRRRRHQWTESDETIQIVIIA